MKRKKPALPALASIQGAQRMTVRSTCYDSSTNNFQDQASHDEANDDFDLSPIVESVDDCLADLDDDLERDARHAKANVSFLTRLNGAAAAPREIKAEMISVHVPSAVTPAVIALIPDALPFAIGAHWKDAAAVYRRREAIKKAEGQAERKIVSDAKKAATASRRVIKERARSAQRRAAAAEVKADPDARVLVRFTRLKAATAKTHRDRRLQKILGRELSYSMFWRAMIEARTTHGPRCSDRLIAAEYTALTGEPLTKRQAANRRTVVDKLEAPGGVWAQLK